MTAELDQLRKRIALLESLLNEATGVLEAVGMRHSAEHFRSAAGLEPHDQDGGAK